MNKLDHIADFKNLLSDYQASDRSIKILNETKFVLLAAISSAGRNTMIRQLAQSNKYHFIVSDTTRKPRVNDGILEQDGREYWFKTEEQFLEGLRQGKYLEAAIIHNQQVSGVSIDELTRAKKEGKIAISDIDVQGVDALYAQSNSCIPVFVLPPSYAEWRQRLKNRGHMTDNELQNRLESAKKELRFALDKQYYHFLVNNSLDESTKGLDKIANGQIDSSHEQHGREVAQQILEELRTSTQAH